MRPLSGFGLVAAVLMSLTFQRCNADEHRLALLVQVSEFKTPGDVLPLKAPGEVQVDAQMLGKILADTYKFSPTILEQTNATHDAILSALDKVATDATAGDAVLFYFSGHGANNTKQFSICPWDVILTSTDHDVTETDLQHWLDKLHQKNVTNVTIILDSCFSMPGVRSTIKAREKLMRRSLIDADTAIPIHLNPDEAVVLAAAGKNGTAYEGTPDASNPKNLIGLYTGFLCEELASPRPETTFRQISDAVTLNVTHFVTVMQKESRDTYPNQQTPGIFGSTALTDRPLFSAVSLVSPPPPAATPSVAYAKVVEFNAGKVTIDRGKDTGVQVGDTYDIYPAGEIQFTDPARKVGSFKVAEVQPDHSVGTVLDGAKPDMIVMDDRAKLAVRHVDLSKSAEIVIKVDGTPGFNKAMVDELAQFPFIKTSGQPQVVIKGTDAGGKLQATVYGADGVSAYETDSINSGKATYSGANSAELCTAMSPLLAQLITMEAIYLLKNPSPSFPVQVSTSKQVYYIGTDRGDFSVKVGHDGYLFIFDIDSAGTPALIFPATDKEQNKVTANAPIQFPLRGEKIEFFPPAGTDTLVAVLITDEHLAADIRTHLFGQNDATRIQPDQRLVRVSQDLAKIDLGPTDMWNIALSAFTTSDMPVPGPK